MRITLQSNPKKRHSVTVVIPCYNYGHFLGVAIQSAFDQVHVDCRAIIVDDNSTDDSLHIAYGLAKRDRRLTVISHKENLGHIRTYNHGLSEVDTEFVTLVSADDLVAPGALDRAVALMERFPSVGLVYGKTLTFADRVELTTCQTWRRCLAYLDWACLDSEYRLKRLQSDPLT